MIDSFVGAQIDLLAYFLSLLDSQVHWANHLKWAWAAVIYLSISRKPISVNTTAGLYSQCRVNKSFGR